MFCDSEIVNSYELGRCKLGHFTNFGLAPYFHDLLNEDIDRSSYFSISFDESLDEMFQNCQLDLTVRYCDDQRKRSKQDTTIHNFLGIPLQRIF